MELRLSYFPGEHSSLDLSYPGWVFESSHVAESHVGHAVAHFPSEEELRPIALEVVWFSDYLPLDEFEDYCAETDTLLIGGKLETATKVVERGDFVAYWRPMFDDMGDEVSDEDLEVHAIELRNASKHLAPVIENPNEQVCVGW